MTEFEIMQDKAKVKQNNESYVCQCPICKQINRLKAKFCAKCGHWLLDSNFPAITMTKGDYIRFYNRNMLPKLRGKHSYLSNHGTKQNKIVFIALTMISCINGFHI
jgi:hypothetical protein